MTEHPHGDYRRYKSGRCRCAPCRAANAETADRRRRLIAYGRWNGLTDATGTIRRVQALAVVGWSCAHIASALGIDRSIPRDIARGGRISVQGPTALRYADLYDLWESEPGPSRKAQTHAARHRWPGPEAWTPDTIDDPDAAPLRALVDEEPDEVLVRQVVGICARRFEAGEYRPDLYLAQLGTAVDQAAIVAELHRLRIPVGSIASRLRARPERVKELLGAVRA